MTPRQRKRVTSGAYFKGAPPTLCELRQKLQAVRCRRRHQPRRRPLAKIRLGSPAPATDNENPAQGMGFGRRLSGVPKSLGGTLGWGV